MVVASAIDLHDRTQSTTTTPLSATEVSFCTILDATPVIAADAESAGKSPEKIKRTLGLLFNQGDTICISMLVSNPDESSKKKHLMLKKFHADQERIANFITKVDEAGAYLDRKSGKKYAILGFYVNLQHLKSGSTSDKREDIDQYQHFMIDIDRRVKKSNASDEELAILARVGVALANTIWQAKQVDTIRPLGMTLRLIRQAPTSSALTLGDLVGDLNRSIYSRMSAMIFSHCSAISVESTVGKNLIPKPAHFFASHGLIHKKPKSIALAFASLIITFTFSRTSGLST
jgi:hypothetical protein